jgi:hypothetical protein
MIATLTITADDGTVLARQAHYVAPGSSGMLSEHRIERDGVTITSYRVGIEALPPRFETEPMIE